MFFTSVSSNKVPHPPNGTIPSPAIAPKKQGKSPKDTLEFGVCGIWLGLVIGAKPEQDMLFPHKGSCRS
ncbi:hypothetical protein L484_020877 [Morus notabilis]|uniref:Uncharacterized protein n=1 Tax=Morus notabilis TaxID=981085 RepID=W9QGN5_9ROSA|nr:hypothetical protein L484_020877 [Morus notabilis]